MEGQGCYVHVVVNIADLFFKMVEIVLVFHGCRIMVHYDMKKTLETRLY